MNSSEVISADIRNVHLCSVLTTVSVTYMVEGSVLGNIDGIKYLLEDAT